MLVEKINSRADGIVLYGLVPPKQGTEAALVKEIADRQVARLKDLNIDGLVLYDIQDEASRTSEERPFPFMETIDSFEYSRRYMGNLSVPKIVYRAVGRYSQPELSEFLGQLDPSRDLTVFVGAASSGQQVSMSVSDAYSLKNSESPDTLLGGVVIPERHKVKGDEHLRVFNKIDKGCRFFLSQGVYDVNASKDFLSDYYYYAKEHNKPLVPIIFTFTPCGSTKTLQFMEWLGIAIPRWLKNDLLHSDDILQKSVDSCEHNWRELKDFAQAKGIPIGCNIESVAVRKVEVEASIELLRRVTQ
ncbi:hypothetical protein [Aurantivibrio plasticivorans]